MYFLSDDTGFRARVGRSTNFRSTPFRSTSSLVFLVALLLSTTSAFATCPTGTGVSGVDIAFIDLDADGIPDIETSDKERNERARISSSLATKLGLALAPGADVFPQIRVIAPSVDIDVDPVDFHAGTGVFSVYEIFTDDENDEVQVWADEDASDDESGEYRLFEESTPADLSTIHVTVHAQAPSRTSVRTNGGTWVDTDHFCEPGAGSYLVESVDLYADKRFALLVPHGGEIESETSEQVAPMTAAFQAHGIDANVWDVQADWFTGRDESEHWHITSSEVSEDGFPGLEEMVDAADFATGRPFQYVASLHGMRFSKEGLVIGGRAHREAKCLVGLRVRERMAAENLAVPAVYVWNYDSDLDESVEVPHGDGTTTITGERGSDPGLSGTSRDNVVNRLSPNENGTAGFGGFQIEQSPALRDVTSYRDLVAAEIADAFAELIANPNLFDPNETAICDALENGEPAPTAAIRGRAWWDEGGDHVQNGAAEEGAENVSVDLLDAANALVASTFTDADGLYAFDYLVPGDYRVRVNVSSALDFVAANQGGDDTLDSDVDATGLTGTITVAASTTVEHVDAGVTRAVGGATIGDLAWLDTVANDVQDAGDEPLVGITVELLDGNRVPLESTVTDGGGFYAFQGLPAGAYVVRFSPPPGYEAVDADQGGDDSLDSDINESFEKSVLIFSPTSTNLDLDAGFRTNCQDAVLVAFGSEWRWSTAFDAGWNLPSYVEPAGTWTEAQATLGYGLSAVESTISDTSTTVVYARLEFEIEDPTLFDAVDLSLFRNDGAVVYLNGTEVLRSNVPTSGSGSATVDQQVTSPGFVAGTNLLAIEVHRTSSPASLAFDLEMSTRICRPCVERVEIPADRVTYVRDGSSTNRGDRTTAQMDASTEENALFAWPVAAALPADAEVLHASILWRVTDDSSDTFHLYPVEVSWDEAAADWFRRSDSPQLDWHTPGVNDGAFEDEGDTERDYAGDEPLASFRFDDGDFGDPPFLGRVVLNVGGRGLVQGWARGERGEHGVLVPGEGGGNKLAVDSDDPDLVADPDALVPTLEVVYRSCGD